MCTVLFVLSSLTTQHEPHILKPKHEKNTVSSYTRIRYTTGTSLFMCRKVEDGFLDDHDWYSHQIGRTVLVINGRLASET